jgi:hypothetical protein
MFRIDPRPLFYCVARAHLRTDGDVDFLREKASLASNIPSSC